MLKSRSSDAFTSQLKDFISPVPINLNNCAQVIIRKETVPDGAAGSFDFEKSFATDPTTSNEFSLSDGGVKDYGKTVLFGSGYTVEETDLPDGFALTDIDCDASTGVTPTIALATNTVTFALDSDDDVLDCTFTNTRQTGAIEITKTRKHAATVLDPDPHQGVVFTITGGGLTEGVTATTGADGKACVDGLLLSSIVGDYTVTETVPAGYVSDGDTKDRPGDLRQRNHGRGQLQQHAADRRHGVRRLAGGRRHGLDHLVHGRGRQRFRRPDGRRR
jgi:hypothetical protein